MLKRIANPTNINPKIANIFPLSLYLLYCPNPQTENTIAIILIRMLIIDVLSVGVDKTTHPRITAGITTEKLTLLKTFTLPDFVGTG